MQELLSVVFTPFVLLVSLPNCAEQIVDFFRDFTVHVDGLGYVCSFAQFDFERHGNAKYGAPTHNEDEHWVSKDGKMEKSFLNFKVSVERKKKKKKKIRATIREGGQMLNDDAYHCVFSG